MMAMAEPGSRYPETGSRMRFSSILRFIIRPVVLVRSAGSAPALPSSSLDDVDVDVVDVSPDAPGLASDQTRTSTSFHDSCTGATSKKADLVDLSPVGAAAADVDDAPTDDCDGADDDSLDE